MNKSTAEVVLFTAQVKLRTYCSDLDSRIHARFALRRQVDGEASLCEKALALGDKEY